MLYAGIFFVGLLGVLGHGVRVLSFSFCLSGSTTAGVILTGVAIFLVPLMFPAVFYGLEVLCGFIQASIFAGTDCGVWLCGGQRAGTLTLDRE